MNQPDTREMWRVPEPLRDEFLAVEQRLWLATIALNEANGEYHQAIVERLEFNKRLMTYRQEQLLIY